MTNLQHRVLTVMATLALAAAVAGIGLSWHNAQQRLGIAQGQQYLQQSVQLESLYRDMVRALAELSARGPDDGLQALLQRHGIQYSPRVDPPVTPRIESAPARRQTAPSPAQGPRP
jgi:hypothetical protein